MRFGSLVLLLCLPVSAQQFPDAATILQTARVLQQERTLQFAADVTMEAGTAGAPVKMLSTADVAIAGPNHFRVEMKAGMMGDFTTVADGKYTWTYYARTKRYWKVSASQQEPL